MKESKTMKKLPECFDKDKVTIMHDGKLLTLFLLARERLYLISYVDLNNVTYEQVIKKLKCMSCDQHCSPSNRCYVTHVRDVAICEKCMDTALNNDLQLCYQQNPYYSVSDIKKCSKNLQETLI